MKNEPVWRWQELLEATAGTMHGTAPDQGITGLTIDSRQVSPGALFVALPGDLSNRFHVSSKSGRDGHDFLQSAADAGAAAALVSRLGTAELPQILVEDTVDALWRLGHAARMRLRGPVIAVTGSSGKTTCKSMLQEALGAFATPGSLNNHLGVPMSLALTPEDAPAAVYEIGTSSSGEIAPLSRMVAPDVAILLNVQQAHLENFRNREALRAEKCSIAEGLGEGGTFVVHDEVRISPENGCRVITFGEADTADIRLTEVTREQATFQIGGREVLACIPGGGRHRALTLGAVIATFVALGRDMSPALTLSDHTVPGGRGNRLVAGAVTVLDDSYNANPASMTAALDSLLNETVSGRRIAVLGEMLELGDASEREHAALAGKLTRFDAVWLVGAGMNAVSSFENLSDRFARADDELLEAVISALEPGDCVLIKGSNRVFWAENFVQKLVERIKKSPALGETPGNYH